MLLFSVSDNGPSQKSIPFVFSILTVNQFIYQLYKSTRMYYTTGLTVCKFHLLPSW